MSDETPAPPNAGGRPQKARGVATTSAEAGPAWSIRGVPPNVRAIAKREADARGATVGDWVSEAIVRYARGAEPAAASDVTEVSSDRQLATVEAPPAEWTQAESLAEAQARLARSIDRHTRELRMARYRRR